MMKIKIPRFSVLLPFILLIGCAHKTPFIPGTPDLRTTFKVDTNNELKILISTKPDARISIQNVSAKLSDINKGRFFLDKENINESTKSVGLGSLRSISGGLVRITTRNEKQQLVDEIVRFSIGKRTSEHITAIHSGDGQMTLYIAPNSLPESARVLISKSHSASIPPPPGLSVINGPFTATILGQSLVSVRAILKIILPSGENLNNKPTILWLDPGIMKWKPLKTYHGPGNMVQAEVKQLGEFILTVQ